MDDIVGAVRSVPLFADLSEAEARKLVAVGKQVQFAPGKAVATEGASGVGFHLVLDGRASVTVGDAERAELGPGDCFGEMSLLDGQPRSATVTAVTDLHTFALASWDFLAFVDGNPGVARKLLAALSRRIRAIEGSGSS